MAERRCRLTYADTLPKRDLSSQESLLCWSVCVRIVIQDGGAHRSYGDGNSGVFFHTGFKPGSVDTTQGMQFEIDCKMMHHTGGVYGEDGRGWVVWPAPENESVVRMREWNDYLVEVVGNHYIGKVHHGHTVQSGPIQARSMAGLRCNFTPAARATSTLKIYGFAICPIAREFDSLARGPSPVNQ